MCYESLDISNVMHWRILHMFAYIRADFQNKRNASTSHCFHTDKTKAYLYARQDQERKKGNLSSSQKCLHVFRLYPLFLKNL